ncbi:MAG: response regulator, partial [Planctomycetota bacterium]
SMVEGASATPRMQVAVRDTGIGIAPEQIKKLFRPFQQADHTIAEEFGGTGLGLSISRSLANRLGGDITVASAEGVGSCFTLEIEAPPPLAGESVSVEPASAADTRDDDGRALQGCRVLVVDDVPANREIARVVLARAGAEVATAEDGKQALRHAEAARFDLVLMDIQMPRMNGMEVTRRLRASGFQAPILALTAFSSRADRNECLEAGMDDFLPKPFEPSMLLESSARWIRVKGARGSSGSGSERFDADMLDVAIDWLRSVPARLASASEALSRGDAAEAAHIAHAIMGSGGTLGFPEITEPAPRLEQACMMGHCEAATEEIERLRALHGDLTARLDTYRAA